MMSLKISKPGLSCERPGFAIEWADKSARVLALAVVFRSLRSPGVAIFSHPQ
jgi:hypothetical protein